MYKIAKMMTQWIGTPQSIIFHTLFFTGMFLWWIVDATRRDHILLVLTTLVSLEAIYQMLFLQLTVNQQGKDLTEVKTAMDEVQDHVEEMHETVEEIQENTQEEEIVVLEVKE